jgi:hypothetical protein
MSHMLRERLAAVVHGLWSHWMRHLFRCAGYEGVGCIVIDPTMAAKWWAQAHQGYGELSAREQESDRELADTVLDTLEDWRRTVQADEAPSAGTCPVCGETLVRAHFHLEDGWRVFWMCDCEPDPVIAGEGVVGEDPFE